MALEHCDVINDILSNVKQACFYTSKTLTPAVTQLAHLLSPSLCGKHCRSISLNIIGCTERDDFIEGIRLFTSKENCGHIHSINDVKEIPTFFPIGVPYSKMSKYESVSIFILYDIPQRDKQKWDCAFKTYLERTSHIFRVLVIFVYSIVPDEFRNVMRKHDTLTDYDGVFMDLIFKYQLEHIFLRPYTFDEVSTKLGCYLHTLVTTGQYNYQQTHPVICTMDDKLLDPALYGYNFDFSAISFRIKQIYTPIYTKLMSVFQIVDINDVTCHALPRNLHVKLSLDRHTVQAFASQDDTQLSLICTSPLVDSKNLKQRITHMNECLENTQIENKEFLTHDSSLLSIRYQDVLTAEQTATSIISRFNQPNSLILYDPKSQIVQGISNENIYSSTILSSAIPSAAFRNWVTKINEDVHILKQKSQDVNILKREVDKLKKELKAVKRSKKRKQSTKNGCISWSGGRKRWDITYYIGNGWKNTSITARKSPAFIMKKCQQLGLSDEVIENWSRNLLPLAE